MLIAIWTEQSTDPENQSHASSAEKEVSVKRTRQCSVYQWQVMEKEKGDVSRMIGTNRPQQDISSITFELGLKKSMLILTSYFSPRNKWKKET